MAHRTLGENDAKELKFLILSESRVNWNEDMKWQTEAIIQEISYSNLETVRYSPKSVCQSLPDYTEELTALLFA